MLNSLKKALLVTFALVIINCVMTTSLVIASEDKSVPLTNSGFLDILSTDDDAAYINYLAGQGIISGFPDGKFHPGDSLTRAQAAVVIARAAKLQYKSAAENTFSDVNPGHWAAPSIVAATQAGYLKGYPGGTFRPEEQLTRAQGIALILRLSNQPIPAVELPNISDVKTNHWAANSIAAGIASGMMGLSKDGQQFLPDAPFTRQNMVHALGFLLTSEPNLYQTVLEGKIRPIKGNVIITSNTGTKKEIKSENSLCVGDIVTTDLSGSAAITYSDGSSVLLTDNTEIRIKDTQGRLYVRNDGTSGTAVDSLAFDLSKGTIFGALASNQFQGSQVEDEKEKSVTRNFDDNILIASLDPWSLLAAAKTADSNLPWWEAKKAKKVKVKVDMPWGVAAIRGTFFKITVNSNGSSNVSCLTGNAEVTNHGETVFLTEGQRSTVEQSTSPPTKVSELSKEDKEQFAQQKEWIEQTAQNMDQNREALSAPPPLATSEVHDVRNISAAQQQSEQSAVDRALSTLINVEQAMERTGVLSIVPTTNNATPTYSSGGGGGQYSQPQIRLSAQITASTIKVDERANIIITSTPADANLSFSSSDISVATVNETTGEVTGISPGTATITVTGEKEGYTSATTTINVTVKSKPVIELNAQITKPTIKEGESANIKVTGTTEGTIIRYTSSNPSVAIVDATTGQVTGIAPGIATITIAGEKAGYTISTETLNITIEAKPAIQLTAQIAKSTIKVNETSIITANSTPADASMLYTSSNTSIATVDATTGQVTGIAPGVASITITGEKTGYTKTTTTVNITVEAKPIIQLSAQINPATIKVGEIANIKATSTPADASLVYNSSNVSAAIVNPTTGEVTGIAPGIATLTIAGEKAGYTGASTNVNITVEVKPVIQLSAEINLTTIKVDEITNIKATSTTEGTTIGYTSSNPLVVTVDASTGEVTGIAPGIATITIAGEKTGYTSATTTVNITVVAKPVIQLSAQIIPTTIKVDETANIKATSTTEATTIGYTSNNPSVATVNLNGEVTGMAPGVATITIAGEKTGYTSATTTVNITVEAKPVIQLSARITKLPLKVGETETITATSTITDITIGYTSSDTTVATVNSNGEVTGISPGTATITITGEKEGYTQGTTTMNITVEAKPVIQISAQISKSTIKVGEATKITAANTTADTIIEYSSSNSAVATVNSNGEVTGIAPGTATITIAGEKEGYTKGTTTVNITVEAKPVIQLIAQITESTIKVSETATITAASTTEGTSIGYTSSNTSVAIVDAVTGQVTGIAPGIATITVTGEKEGYTGATTSINITIEAKPVIQLSAQITPATIKVGETATITAASTTEGTSIGYTSSNTSVAIVDASTGQVTGIAPGAAIITIAGEKEGYTSATTTLNITVEAKPILQINVQITKSIIEVGEAASIFVTSIPEYDSLKFSSSDTSVLTVNETGEVIRIAPGIVTITITGEKEGYTSATKILNISAEAKPVIQLSSQLKPATIKAGETATITTDSTPTDASISYTSSNTSVATVDAATGQVTGIAPGFATITIAGEKEGYTSTTTTLNITVEAKPVIQLIGQIKPATIKVDETANIITTSTPSDTSISYTSSNTSVVIVDATTGQVTGIAPGIASLTIAGEKEGYTSATTTLNITVEAQPVIQLNAQITKSTIKVGETATITAASTTEGTSIGYTSSNTSAAIVDAATGQVTGIAPGAAIITIIGEKEGYISATITLNITVEAKPVIQLNAQITKSTIKVGETATITAASTTEGTSIGYTSSNTSVAIVDAATGQVTGIAPGIAIITITGEKEGYINATTTLNLTVEAKPVIQLSAQITKSTIKVGETATITAASTTEGTSIGYTSSNTSIAIVDAATGQVTGIAPGIATITVTGEKEGYTGATTSINMTIEAKPVIQLNAQITKSTIKVGETATITAASTTEGTSIGYTSSSTSVAIVDAATGQVTGIAPGAATITITGEKEGCTSATITLNVTVEAKPVIQLIAQITRTIIKVGDTAEITAASTPADASIRYNSSNTSIAAVNAATGEITGIAPGIATITVTGEKEGYISTTSSVNITVEAIPIIQLNAQITRAIIKVGETVNITAVSTPANASISYKASNTSVATVNATTGEITGIAPGITTITVTGEEAGYISATTNVNITVEAQPVIQLGAQINPMSIVVGEKANIVVTSTPADANLSFNSSNTSVATVNTATGEVTGIAPGAATISITAARSGYQTASTNVTITVTPKLGLNGTISMDAGVYQLGDTITITVNDNDLNTDPGSKQNVDVICKSSSDNVGIIITLTESQNNTGLFTGSMKLRKTTNANLNPKNLQVVVGDTVTATYDDNLDAAGNDPVAVTATAMVTKGITASLDLKQKGRVITITVVDNDMNTSSDSIQEITVNVNSSTTHTNGFDLVLTETRVNSGQFSGTLSALEYSTGEIITTTYYDQLDEDGNLNPITVSITR